MFGTFTDSAKQSIIVEKNKITLELSLDEIEQIIQAIPTICWSNTITRHLEGLSVSVVPLELKTALSNAWSLLDADIKKARGFYRVSIGKLGFD